MEASLLKALLSSVASFFHISSCDNLDCEPVRTNYQKIEEILKLLKPVLDVLVDFDLDSDELINKAFDQLGQSIDDSRDLLENWLPLASRVYLVLEAESLLIKIRDSVLEIFQSLKYAKDRLPTELSSSSIEYCSLRTKNIQSEQTQTLISEALKDQASGKGPSSECLVKVAESLGLTTNQQILIEAVALEKLKDNAEQTENSAEVEYIDQLISLVMRLHDRLVTIKQSQSCTPIPIPPDFCCPLSLELMTDPVIVASGQTYERAYIRKWLDLGLNVCPKTRQSLSHTNLIPNYTVKALIANWCELNNVKIPDPLKSMRMSQPLSVISHPDHGNDAVKEVRMVSPARGNRRPTSPETCPSIDADSMFNDLSPRLRREGASPSRSGYGTDGSVGAERVSTEDRSCRSEGNNSHQNGLSPKSPSRNDHHLPVAAGFHENISSPGHSRMSSDSSAVSESSVPRQLSGDADQVSRSPANDSSDASGELMKESPSSNIPNTSQREREFPPRMIDSRSRAQALWRRPSDRLIPRVVSSSAVEIRPDLSAIQSQVEKLVEELKGTSLDAQREATSEIRLLAKHNMDNRIVIADCGAITLLVDLLHSADIETQENAVTALLNLSLNDNNKTAIANAGAIEPLIHVLKTGTAEARENSAATLFSLSVFEENKVKIGRSGAIPPLVELLVSGTPRGKKDAATALFNLSICHENKARIVQAGAVKHLVELMDPAAGMVDKAVAVLANLATIPEGRSAIGLAGGIPVLVEVVELGSPRGKENAAAALLHLCTTSARFCNMVLQEGAVPPLVALSQSGTARAREKAQALLSYFRNQRNGNPGKG